MANLSITSECNRSCDYCFAQPVFATKMQRPGFMSQKVFQQALDFIERSEIDQARLLGGEPTLHPEFCTFVDQVLKRGLGLLIFSNGLMPEKAIQRLEETSLEHVTVLINCSNPKELKAEEQEKIFSVFRRLGPLILLGINIHTPCPQLDFSLDLIREYNLKTRLRLGLAHPCVGGGNHFLPVQYYSVVGRRVVTFSECACEAGVKLEFDCGFVPCMFPEVNVESLGKSVSEVGQRCNPILDVLPDGKVVSCYPLTRLANFALPQQETAMQLKKQFEKQLQPYRDLGIYRECAICELRQSGECLGGCLAAATKRLRNSSEVFRLPVGARSEFIPSKSLSLPIDKQTQTDNDERRKSSHSISDPRVVVPYIDQPFSFWEQVAEKYERFIKEVYFPLPGNTIGSGRPEQPSKHLYEFILRSTFALTVLVNPITLPRPVEDLAPLVTENLNRLISQNGSIGITVSNLTLASHLREQFPDLPITASVLMDISQPNQALMLKGICDTLVPASRIMRDLPALKALRAAFSGRIRLIVNEGCLPGCLFRVQHFQEMAGKINHPRSLCEDLLDCHPWLRLTGAWVLPQHLHLFDGLYDELKIAGRVTLHNPVDFLRVLEAYIYRNPLSPNQIGAGPAAVQEPLYISREFYRQTLNCGRQCHKCAICQDYYQSAITSDHNFPVN